MKSGTHLSQVRERSRSARERSKTLRLASKEIRESLENLRAFAAGINETKTSGAHAAEQQVPPSGHPLNVAAWMRERVRKARAQAKTLRHRAADLKTEAADFRQRSQSLRRNLPSL